MSILFLFTKAALFIADQIAQIARTIWTVLAGQLGNLGNNKEMQLLFASGNKCQ